MPSRYIGTKRFRGLPSCFWTDVTACEKNLLRSHMIYVYYATGMLLYYSEYNLCLRKQRLKRNTLVLLHREAKRARATVECSLITVSHLLVV